MQCTIRWLSRMAFERACRDGALRRQVDSSNSMEDSVWDTDLCPHARLLKKWGLLHPRCIGCWSRDVDMPGESLMPSMQSTNLQVTSNAAVLQLCNAGDVIAAGLSNGVVCLVRWGDMGLQQVGQWKGHTAAIRGLLFMDSLLYTASEDGNARAWDVRTMQEVQRFTHGGKAGLSAISASASLLVGGADDGTLLFWDRATGNLRASFHDTHPEAVTQVLFPEHSSEGAEWMISSSADGLISVMDLRDGLDEDNAFRAGLNSTPSVASCGVYGPKLWALSQVESIHLWEWAAATDEEVPGGEGTHCDDHDVRSSLTAAQQRMQGQPEPHALVGMSSCEGALRLASTSATGDIAVFRVAEPDIPGTAPGYTPELVLKGAHSDIVRAMLWPDAWAQYYVTGGDDGVIALWYGSNAEASPVPEEPNADPRSTKRQRLN